MVLNEVNKSIYAIYRTQTQIVTRVIMAHSLLCFAFAKLNKKFGFCKVLHEKNKVNFAVI